MLECSLTTKMCKRFLFINSFFYILFCVSNKPEEENWDTVVSKSDTFHKYPLSLTTIHVLSTEKDFEQFLALGLTVSK